MNTFLIIVAICVLASIFLMVFLWLSQRRHWKAHHSIFIAEDEPIHDIRRKLK